MPKYRNKVRLKKYLSNHNISDKLIEFLILNDYPDKIIETDEPHIKNASEKKDQWWLFRQLK
jgi:hypothetical protein